jgi:hypothetical protein
MFFLLPGTDRFLLAFPATFALLEGAFILANLQDFSAILFPHASTLLFSLLHTMKRQPGTPLARGYRRQRSEPQVAVATRGCCDLAIPREKRLRSPGCMACR